MYTPKNKITESRHPLIQQYGSFFKKEMTFREREQKIVELYEKNLDFFNNVVCINSNLTISKLIEIKISYIRFLDNKSEYKRGKEIADHIKLLLGKLDKNYYNYDLLYLNGLKWVAINLGRRKKYRASNKIFKELVKIDKYREFYQNWIIHNLCDIYSDYAYILLGILFLWVFKKEFFNIDITLSLSVGIMIVIFTILLLLFIFFQKKIISYYVQKKYR